MYIKTYIKLIYIFQIFPFLIHCTYYTNITFSYIRFFLRAFVIIKSKGKKKNYRFQLPSKPHNRR